MFDQQQYRNASSRPFPNERRTGDRKETVTEHPFNPDAGNSTQAPCAAVRSPGNTTPIACASDNRYPISMNNNLFTNPFRHVTASNGVLHAQSSPANALDCSGYAIFSDGELGAMHVMAHRLLDENQFESGHAILKAWLAGRTGAGKRWVHIQWHMAIFEMALADWDGALERFRQHILPAVVNSNDALTDAPAFLWRLSLGSPGKDMLPWYAVRDRALLALRDRCSPFVTMHNLLALAGAGDLDNLDIWVDRRDQSEATASTRAVSLFAKAIRWFAGGDYARAADAFDRFAPSVNTVGGSRAQNDLFTCLLSAARQRAGITPPAISAALAA